LTDGNCDLSRRYEAIQNPKKNNLKSLDSPTPTFQYIQYHAFNPKVVENKDGVYYYDSDEEFVYLNIYNSFDCSGSPILQQEYISNACINADDWSYRYLFVDGMLIIVC
jgi:hypothetical protein